MYCPTFFDIDEEMNKNDHVLILPGSITFATRQTGIIIYIGQVIWIIFYITLRIIPAKRYFIDSEMLCKKKEKWRSSSVFATDFVANTCKRGNAKTWSVSRVTRFFIADKILSRSSATVLTAPTFSLHQIHGSFKLLSSRREYRLNLQEDKHQNASLRLNVGVSDRLMVKVTKNIFLS